MVAWRTRNVSCLELMPQELEASVRSVTHVKAYSNIFFFKENLFDWRTENIRCIELIPAELEASMETEGTVEPWLLTEGFGMISCGCPCMWGPRKVIHHYKWVLNKFNDWNYIYIWSDKT